MGNFRIITMRLSDLISLGQRSLLLGVVAILILLPVFLLIYKKYLKEKYPLTPLPTEGEEIHLVSDATEEELRTALLKYDIKVPEEAEFEAIDKGYYKFKVEQLLQNDTMLDGEISFQYYENGCVSHLKNALLR